MTKLGKEESQDIKMEEMEIILMTLSINQLISTTTIMYRITHTLREIRILEL